MDMPSPMSRLMGGPVGIVATEVVFRLLDDTDEQLDFILAALKEIDRTIIDGFAGVDVVLGRLNRQKENVEAALKSNKSLKDLLDIIPGTDFKFAADAIESLRPEPGTLFGDPNDFPKPLQDLVNKLDKQIQDAFESAKNSILDISPESIVDSNIKRGETKISELESQIKQRNEKIGARPGTAPSLGQLDPATLTELNKLLGELTATIGAEDGLLGRFRDL